MSAAAIPLTVSSARIRRVGLGLLFVLLLLVCAIAASLAIGPVAIAPGRVFEVLAHAATGATPDRLDRETIVILDIRLPRTLLGLLVGGATALAGAVMQGLFRNPLADPGIVGISSGAALAAAAWIVYGGSLAFLLPVTLGGFGLPIAAFAGGLLMTAILHAVSTSEGRTSILTLLLAGVALTGLASAGIGLLVFLASDQQLREFTFWTLGSLGGATYAKIVLILPFILFLLVLAPALARALDALALGEADAFHSGVDVEKLKRLAILGVAAAIGASVAVSGVIGFFGLTVPHLVRLAIGPAHRALLPISALAGGAVLIFADLVARTVAAPAELPLGILTAGIGGPIMLWLVLSRRRLLLG
jgi:iron complex transport system permease protein